LTASSWSAAGPKTIVSDNGTELTSTAILAWSDSGRLALHRTRKPVQNPFIESFNGRLRGAMKADICRPRPRRARRLRFLMMTGSPLGHTTGA
jgi:hypothetical protein